MCEYINKAIIQEDFTMEKTIYDESNGSFIFPPVSILVDIMC